MANLRVSTRPLSCLGLAVVGLDWPFHVAIIVLAYFVVSLELGRWEILHEPDFPLPSDHLHAARVVYSMGS
jgi:hypothetical protein